MVEIIVCVVDEKHKLLHHFHSCASTPQPFSFPGAFDGQVLSEALETRQPTSIIFSYGSGQRKFLSVLPYEWKKGKWRFACMQMTTEPPGPDAAAVPGACTMAEERGCLLLADKNNIVRSVSPRIPEAFGCVRENLGGMSLSCLLSESDLGSLNARPADRNEAISGCVFHGLDGSRRDVDIWKFSAPDGLVLYVICDVSPAQFNEEFNEAVSRERRRIGQDLHDSIGQLMTAISLLSRSLANSLTRENNEGARDAAQISGLADEASEQIRQVSRGLMPAEIVDRGLFESLRELARTTTESCGVECVFRGQEPVFFSDGAVETHLYRIAQEAVNNAVRHARASAIEIMLSADSGGRRMMVVDNGTWKVPDTGMIGIGLKTMEYRASAIGGRLEVGAHRQGGTKVECRLSAEESTARGG